MLGLLCTVSIGTIQFGFSLASWNVMNSAYTAYYDWGDDATKNLSLVQSLLTGGGAVGALGSGSLLRIGRWNCIVITNIVIILGGGISMIPGLGWVCIGRFLTGLGVGAFTVFCPKYIIETAPISVRGPAGSLTSIGICTGILISFTIGVFFPEVEDGSESSQLTLIIIVLGFPILMALIQLTLMFTVYPYDTPPYLFQNDKKASLEALFAKIYRQPDMEQLTAELRPDQENTAQRPGTLKSFTDPLYRKASFVGCVTALA